MEKVEARFRVPFAKNPELSQPHYGWLFLKNQRTSSDSQTVLGDKCKRFLK